MATADFPPSAHLLHVRAALDERARRTSPNPHRPPLPAPVRRVLLVEDDARIGAEVAAALQRGGFAADVAGTLADARRLAGAATYDAILLDLGLPDGDGLQLCAELRARADAVPIIVLTARDAPEQRVLGIETGADDYLVKPFHVPELLARLRRLLQRTSPPPPHELVRAGSLWADPGERCAGRRDETFVMAPREFQLLLFLMRNPGRTWTRRQLIENVWGSDYAGHERVVDLHVARVRLAVETNPRDPQHLETVWGVGYRLREAP